jgi:hypothetical protein
MKRNSFLLWLVLCAGLFSGRFAHSQNPIVIDQVKDAIKAGSAKELAKHLSPSVDITIEGKLQNYSKAQAEFVLRDFFKAHPPSEFSLSHQGQSKGGQSFAIGQLKSGAQTYRIWMKIKLINKDQEFIYEMSFEDWK